MGEAMGARPRRHGSTRLTGATPGRRSGRRNGRRACENRALTGGADRIPTLARGDFAEVAGPGAAYMLEIKDQGRGAPGRRKSHRPARGGGGRQHCTGYDGAGGGDVRFKPPSVGRKWPAYSPQRPAPAQSRDPFLAPRLARRPRARCDECPARDRRITTGWRGASSSTQQRQRTSRPALVATPPVGPPGGGGASAGRCDPPKPKPRRGGWPGTYLPRATNPAITAP